MPPVIEAIILALQWIGVSASWAAFLAPALLSLGASIVLGQITKLFAKGPSVSSLASQLASRTITSRQAIAPWRVLYGSNRVGGVITDLHPTGTNNEKAYLLILNGGLAMKALSAQY